MPSPNFVQSVCFSIRSILPTSHLIKEEAKHLTALFIAALVQPTEEFPGAVFIIDALVTFLVSITNELPRTVFVIGALVAVLV